VAPSTGLEVRIPAGGQRAFLATCVLFLLLVLASLIHREADHQIIEDLERERPRARAMVMGEFLGLAPAVVLGLLLMVWLRHTGKVNAVWPEVMATITPRVPVAAHWVGGLYALASAILSAALGWAVRILGTLAFGKEAFGSGDIYILAAIGAVGGLWLTMIAFLLAAVLALLGVLATSFRKFSRAIPFGPWLALGAFASMWLAKPIIDMFGPAFGWLFWTLIAGTSTWPSGG
jgi:prepilin signal peptidase PulO-like enzyme (type II secretory pathway)